MREGSRGRCEPTMTERCSLWSALSAAACCFYRGSFMQVQVSRHLCVLWYRSTEPTLPDVRQSACGMCVLCFHTLLSKRPYIWQNCVCTCVCVWRFVLVCMQVSSLLAPLPSWCYAVLGDPSDLNIGYDIR